jgi:hypothetical protein
MLLLCVHILNYTRQNMKLQNNTHDKNLKHNPDITTPRYRCVLKLVIRGEGGEYLCLKVYISAKNLRIVKAAILKGITCKRDVDSRHGIRIENMYATPAPQNMLRKCLVQPTTT